MARTRIKVCGLTRAEDVDLAVALGADALGFVLYPASPRALTTAQLAALCARVPPLVTTVALFVNAGADEVRSVFAAAAVQLAQFHGDETPEQCAAYGVPYLRAARVAAGLDLVEFESRFRAARGLLLDSFSAGYGGSGKVFDWSLIPAELAHRAVLSGGLSAQNVAEAIARLHPYAVDVSSGVERAPGVKDAERMRAFFAEVARADASR